MLDDFFIRALLAGIALALAAGPLGCFVVWGRMAYFGDTMAHAALLGVVLGLVAGADPTVAVFAFAVVLATVLLALERISGLATDTLLGILSHGMLATGLVLFATMAGVSVDLLGLLLGDILAVSRTDVGVIWAGAAAVICALALLWRPLVAAIADPDLARAEGLRPDRARWLFAVVLAGVIALALKLVGVLLITALLILPAATARRLAGSPEAMAVAAAGLGAVAVASGLYGSLLIDAPSGPAIVVAALLLFAAVQAGAIVRARLAVPAGRPLGGTGP